MIVTGLVPEPRRIPPSVRLVTPVPPSSTSIGESKLMVTVLPLPLVTIPSPPNKLRTFATGTPVPESVTKDVGTEGVEDTDIIPA